MTSREEKFVDVVNSVARDLDSYYAGHLWSTKLQKAIEDFCGEEPTPMEKAQEAVMVGQVDDLGALGPEEYKSKREDLEIARERLEDAQR